MFFLLTSILIALIILLFVIWSVYCRFCRQGRLLHKIPGPEGVFGFGNLFQIVMNPEDLFKYLRENYRIYKGIFKLYAFHVRYVHIYDPDDIEKILSTTRFNEKYLPYNFFYPWLGSGLLVSNGKKWHERRKMLTSAFHFNILEKFLLTINEQTSIFLDNVEEEVGKEKTNIQPLIHNATLRIICETSMGTSMREDLNSVSTKYLNALHLLGECILYRVIRVWTYENIVFRFTKIAEIQKQALKDLHRFTRNIIQQRREFINDKRIECDEDRDLGKKNRMAMLDLLLEQEKQGNIDEDGIREEVDTFMFEGHDTTASALCFMVMRIANEPEIQRKIHEELESIFGDSERNPTMEDLREMKYLECCIKESLRLYPSVPFISRCLKEEVVLSGYTVPKLTICSIHIYDLHHREDIYPEPEKFIPERFLPDNAAKRHPYAHVPFSAGPRNCIGQKFAMLEMKSAMSGLIRRFQLEPVTRPEEIVYFCDLVLRPTKPIYVRFLNRKGSH